MYKRQDKYGRVSVNDIVIPADIQWTEVKKTIDGHEFVAVSYTHLDVYKRQI